jgi:hypothetical protein
MTDTSAAAAARYRALLLARSGEERLCMAAGMFDSARALMRAALGDADGTDHSPAMRAALFLRTYGGDFDPATRERIAARLRSGA